jgi:hypothetical protein
MIEYKSITKKCTKCLIFKSLSMFDIKNTSKDGKKPHCKRCVSKYYAKRTGRTVEEVEANKANSIVKIINGKKVCTTCLQLKSINNFGKYRPLKCGLDSRCRECMKKSVIAHNFKEARRVKLIWAMGYGGKCICCGEKRIEMLTIEHIRFKGYELIYDHVITLMKKLISMNFPEGYTILCWGCNELTRHGRPCIHSKEYQGYYKANIQPYRYAKQKELDALECRWKGMNGWDRLKEIRLA